MSRIIALSTIKSKPSRRTPRPSAPFGAGITLTHGVADALWWAQQPSPYEDPMPDDEYDRLAIERAFEAAYEAGLARADRCSLCGLNSERPLHGGLCDNCNGFVDAGPVEAEGGICAICRRQVDYLEPSGLCCPCDLHAADLAFSGNRGY